MLDSYYNLLIHNSSNLEGSPNYRLRRTRRLCTRRVERLRRPKRQGADAPVLQPRGSSATRHLNKIRTYTLNRKPSVGTQHTRSATQGFDPRKRLAKPDTMQRVPRTTRTTFNQREKHWASAGSRCMGLVSAIHSINGKSTGPPPGAGAWAWCRPFI